MIWETEALRAGLMCLLVPELPGNKGHLTEQSFFLQSESSELSEWQSWGTNFFVHIIFYFYAQFSSVAQSCLTLCKSMYRSMRGFPVHQQLLDLVQTHVHWGSDAIQSSHSMLSPSPPTFCLSQPSGSFQMSQFFASGGQSIGVSASVSVLPVSIQDWFPLRWTGLISLQSKGLSRVLSNTTVQKHQFFGNQFSL